MQSGDNRPRSVGGNITDEELRALHRAVQEAALKAYPNPERKGCPGRAVLQQMAKLRVPPQHEAYRHVETCSPCLREMLDLQSAESRRRKSLRRSVLAACCLVVLAGALFFQWKVRQNFPAPSAVINFNTTALSRGPQPDAKHPPEIQSFERKKLVVTIYLVPGSDDGPYDFEILSPAEDQVLAHVSGNASIARGLTSLTCEVDFSNLNPGTYTARVKRRSSVAWRSLTIELK